MSAGENSCLTPASEAAMREAAGVVTPLISCVLLENLIFFLCQSGLVIARMRAR